MRFEYTEILQKIEAAIDLELPGVPSDEWLQRRFGPLAVLPGDEDRRALTAPARELIGRGGKRWRPLLQVLVARAFGSGDLALALSPIPEIVHNGTLIVDDIEDGADMRRGGPAVHMVYGVDAAVNGGNLLYFLPAALLEEHVPDPALRAKLYGAYASQLRRVHMGQALDIAWHRDHGRIPSSSEYRLMCALKTGALSGLATRIGAVSENLPAKTEGALVRAFEDAGVAFQILDDVRNLRTGNPGKARGDDIVEGKKSLPVILACGRKSALKESLPRLFLRARQGGPSDPAVEEAIEAIAATGALEGAESEAEALLSSAQKAAQDACPGGTKTKSLLGIFELLAGR
jgi:geranylgeranyl pyrophosphate synthase